MPTINISQPLTTSPMVALDETANTRVLEHLKTYQFAPFVGAIQDDWLVALQAEANARSSGAVLAQQDDGLCYKASITNLGPVALDFLTHPEVTRLLRTYFGGTYTLSKDISCLTFYDATSHLGAHLDEPSEKCTVTIILYLEAIRLGPQTAQTGLVLNVYGADKSSIGAPSLQIPTRSGTLVLGRGSQVWHERPKLQAGESVTAITGCYTVDQQA